MKQRILELQQIYREGEELLRTAGIDESMIDAWYLLEHVTGISRAMYLANPRKEIEESQAEEYFSYIRKRMKRIPLQHITGEQEFMGYTFKVNEHVLIPRQDTEILVEEALKYLKSDMKVLDMCTGSGCILLSLLKMGQERKLLNKLAGTAVDISENALCVAKENAENLGISVEFIHSNLFENVDGIFDMIVSNPPYIRTEVIEGLQEEVRLHDPFIALDGKEDGLFFYRKIVDEGRKFLKKGGMLLFEIGHDQGEDVSMLMKNAGFDNVVVKKDLAGLDRVVFGVYNDYICAYK